MADFGACEKSRLVFQQPFFTRFYIISTLFSDFNHLFFFCNADKMDPPNEVRGYALSPTEVNISWKIPPGYKTVYFVVNVLDYVMKKEFQEVTSDKRTHHIIHNLRPYADYAIYVQLYTDKKARGQSNAFMVKTLETSKFLRCFKTTKTKVPQHKTRHRLNIMLSIEYNTNMQYYAIHMYHSIAALHTT